MRRSRALQSELSTFLIKLRRQNNRELGTARAGNPRHVALPVERGLRLKLAGIAVYPGILIGHQPVFRAVL